MIVRRNRPPKQEQVRRIVKRHATAPHAAHHAPPRQIVRRTDTLGVQPHPAAADGGAWGIPMVGLGSMFGWRPGRSFYFAVFLSAMLAAFAAGGYWAVTSPYFEVNNVTIQGNGVIPLETIEERVTVHGDSMFTVDLDGVHEDLQAMPLVKSVKVERVWPDGVHITIEERQPWGTWEQEGVAYTIDNEGVVLGLMTAPAGSPVIRSSQLGTRQTGDRVDYQAVDAATALYTRLPEVLGENVAEIAYEPERGLVVRTGDGETAIFGDSSSIDYKLAVWAEMAKSAGERHFTYSTIDLRFGNRPVLQP